MTLRGPLVALGFLISSIHASHASDTAIDMLQKGMDADHYEVTHDSNGLSSFSMNETASSFPTDSSSNDMISTETPTKKPSPYAKAKLQAELEGRLAKFKAANKARVARQRARQSEEMKKAISKHEYAKRRMHIERLRLIDPEEAERLEEKRRASLRESGKKYYHTHIDSERVRSREKGRKFRQREKGEGGASTSRIVHDFDLNDEAAVEYK